MMRLWKIDWIVVLLVVVSMVSAQPCDPTKKFKFEVEIAVVWDESNSIDETNFKRMLELTNQLPDWFELGMRHARVAVVGFGNEANMILNLTYDENSIRNVKAERNRANSELRWTLKAIKLQTFAEENIRISAQKIIILFTDAFHDKRDLTEKAATELRTTGTIIYVALLGRDYYNSTVWAKPHIARVATGDPTWPSSNVFHASQFADLMKFLRNNTITKGRCNHYIPSYRYRNANLTKCEFKWWRNVDDSECGPIKPSKNNSGYGEEDHVSKCEWTCDRLWRWKPPICNKDLERDGPMPHYKSIFDFDLILEHCPTTKQNHCARNSSKINHGATTLRGKFPIWGVVLVLILIIFILGEIIGLVFVCLRKQEYETETKALTKEEESLVEGKAAAEESFKPPSTMGPSFDVPIANAPIPQPSPVGKVSMPTPVKSVDQKSDIIPPIAAEHSMGVSMGGADSTRSDPKSSSHPMKTNALKKSMPSKSIPQPKSTPAPKSMVPMNRK